MVLCGMISTNSKSWGNYFWQMLRLQYDSSGNHHFCITTFFIFTGKLFIFSTLTCFLTSGELTYLTKKMAALHFGYCSEPYCNFGYILINCAPIVCVQFIQSSTYILSNLFKLNEDITLSIQACTRWFLCSPQVLGSLKPDIFGIICWDSLLKIITIIILSKDLQIQNIYKIIFCKSILFYNPLKFYKNL